MCCVVTLLALGAVVGFSILSARASCLAVGVKYLAKHMLWIGIGLAGLWGVSRVDYRWLERNRWVIGIVGLVLLVAVLLPGFGTSKYGARRWIRFGPIGFQPSEAAKLALLVTVCSMVARRGEMIRDFRRGALPCMAVVGVTTVLILAEPDFGTAALVGAIGMAVILAGGARLWPIATGAGLGAAAVSFLIWQSPARLDRVLAFLDPRKHQDGAGYQVIHSLMALASGGLFGRTGMQKRFFLPAPDTDFVFSIIGEEFGLVGTLGVVFLFAVLIRQGMRVSECAPDAFGGLLAFGITTMIALQALIHIAVVTASMPTKGIALPFVSSGGSSIVISLLGVGILLNIASHASTPVLTASSRSRASGTQMTLKTLTHQRG